MVLYATYADMVSVTSSTVTSDSVQGCVLTSSGTGVGARDRTRASVGRRRRAASVHADRALLALLPPRALFLHKPLGSREDIPMVENCRRFSPGCVSLREKILEVVSVHVLDRKSESLVKQGLVAASGNEYSQF